MRQIGMTKSMRTSSGASVVVYPDAESLASATAALIAEEASRSVDVQGCFAMALAGGTTPRRTYALLARPPLVDRVPWESVHVFWTDERCVGPDDPRSNEGMAREELLDRVSVPPDHVHPMRCGVGAKPDEDQGAPPAEQAARRCAEKHEALLRRLFPEAHHAATAGVTNPGVAEGTALDLVLHGLGADGHTASLFPGSDALDEDRRWVAPVFVPAAAAAGATTAGDDLWRLTLTAPFINMAAAALFIVSGPAKAPIVAEVLEGPMEAGRLPAQLVRPRSGALRWYLDEASAALLSAA